MFLFRLYLVGKKLCLLINNHSNGGYASFDVKHGLCVLILTQQGLAPSVLLSNNAIYIGYIAM